MAMHFSIARGTMGWSTNRLVFTAIVEKTRLGFKPSEQTCMNSIYNLFDIGATDALVFDLAESPTCFNLFYLHSQAALQSFTAADFKSGIDPDWVPQIRWEWEEVLKLMRADPRYDESFSARYEQQHRKT
jgi:hypothetical protein